MPRRAAAVGKKMEGRSGSGWANRYFLDDENVQKKERVAWEKVLYYERMKAVKIESGRHWHDDVCGHATNELGIGWVRLLWHFVMITHSIWVGKVLSLSVREMKVRVIGHRLRASSRCMPRWTAHESRWGWEAQRRQKKVIYLTKNQYTYIHTYERRGEVCSFGKRRIKTSKLVLKSLNFFSRRLPLTRNQTHFFSSSILLLLSSDRKILLSFFPIDHHHPAALSLLLCCQVALRSQIVIVVIIIIRSEKIEEESEETQNWTQKYIKCIKQQKWGISSECSTGAHF